MSQSYESAPQAPPGPPPGGPSGPRANFGQRLAALLIDGIILTVGGLIIVFILAAISDALGILGYVLWIVAFFAYYTYFEGGPTGADAGQEGAEHSRHRRADGRPGRLRQGVPALPGQVAAERHPVPRLPLDALGSREAVLARQDRRHVRRSGGRLTGRALLPGRGVGSSEASTNRPLSAAMKPIPCPLVAPAPLNRSAASTACA